MTNRNFANFNEFLNIRYFRSVDGIYMDLSDFYYMIERFKKISEENDKLKAEIEQLKEDYSVLARQYNNVENSSIRYYNEVKQLKSEIEQWQSTNFKLVCELTRIECENNQLKSELEQSVKFPLTNADKIRSMSDDELAEFIQDVQCDNHGYFVDKLLSKSANPIYILEMLKREVSE